jgi:hypothetical protein
MFLAIFGLSRATWVWFCTALVFGLIFFFAYGFRKSDPSKIGPVEEPAGLPDYI